jgi:hypothetical protein
VTYHSKNRIPAPCVSNAVVKGTFRRIWGRRAPEIKIKRDGSPADNRLPMTYLAWNIETTCFPPIAVNLE